MRSHIDLGKSWTLFGKIAKMPGSTSVKTFAHLFVPWVLLTKSNTIKFSV